jgi:hypothetical protein
MRHVEPVVAVDPHQLLAVALFEQFHVVVAQQFFTTIGGYTQSFTKTAHTSTLLVCTAW